MPRTLTRRLVVRALLAATPLAFMPRPLAFAQQSSAPAATTNVWAAMLGPLPEGLAELPPRVYVPHENGGDVAVIDPITRQIVDRFGVGRTPHHVTPAYDMSSLYVNVMGGNRMVQIDPWAGRPVRSYPVAAP